MSFVVVCFYHPSIPSGMDLESVHGITLLPLSQSLSLSISRLSALSPRPLRLLPFLSPISLLTHLSPPLSPLLCRYLSLSPFVFSPLSSLSYISFSLSLLCPRFSLPLFSQSNFSLSSLSFFSSLSSPSHTPRSPHFPLPLL